MLAVEEWIFHSIKFDCNFSNGTSMTTHGPQCSHAIDQELHPSLVDGKTEGSWDLSNTADKGTQNLRHSIECLLP